MVEAILKGWCAQQTARGLQEATIGARERLVRRFIAFTNQYPWNWTAGQVEGLLMDPRLTVLADEVDVRLRYTPTRQHHAEDPVVFTARCLGSYAQGQSAPGSWDMGAG